MLVPWVAVDAGDDQRHNGRKDDDGGERLHECDVCAVRRPSWAASPHRPIPMGIDLPRDCGEWPSLAGRLIVGGTQQYPRLRILPCMVRRTRSPNRRAEIS